MDNCSPPSLGYVLFSGIGDLNLLAPNYGNLDEYDFNRINTKSRNNRLILLRPDYWPKSNLLHLTFSTLSDLEKTNIETFYQANFGRFITYTDFIGVPHSGLITTSNLEFKEENDCSWEVNLEFLIVEF